MGRDHVNGKKVFRERCARRGESAATHGSNSARKNSVNNGGYAVPLPAGTEEGRTALRRQLCVEGAVYRAERDSPDAQGQTVFRLLQGALEGAGAESPAGRGEGGGAPRLGKKETVWCLWPETARWMRF